MSAKITMALIPVVTALAFPALATGWQSRQRIHLQVRSVLHAGI